MNRSKEVPAPVLLNELLDVLIFAASEDRRKQLEASRPAVADLTAQQSNRALSLWLRRAVVLALEFVTIDEWNVRRGGEMACSTLHGDRWHGYARDFCRSIGRDVAQAGADLAQQWRAAPGGTIREKRLELRVHAADTASKAMDAVEAALGGGPSQAAHHVALTAGSASLHAWDRMALELMLSVEEACHGL